MRHGAERIIVAFDTKDVQLACRWARMLAGLVHAIKLGLEFMMANGPQGIRAVQASAGETRLFIDGKFSDIPNTVAGAVSAACELQPWMLNVHAMSGLKAMQAAVTAAREYAAQHRCKPPLMIAVTVLTSLDEDALRAIGVPCTPLEEVVRLALLAKEAGFDGIVASPLEVEAVRAACGPNFLIITPGIRPAGSNADDQARLATPTVAVRKGTDYMVIGRAITGADDMILAINAIATETEAAMAA